MSNPRVLIAEVHPLVAQGLKRLIEPDYEVPGIVGASSSLFNSVRRLKPDVVLLSIYKPFEQGLEAGRQLKAAFRNVRIIVLTTNDDAGAAVESLDHWSSGYLHMKSMGGELQAALKDVIRGIKYLTPVLSRRLTRPGVDPLFPSRRILSPRQREVLQLIGAGRDMKRVAETLRISPRTVAFHKYKIMTTFDLRTNAHLMLFAIDQSSTGSIQRGRAKPLAP